MGGFRDPSKYSSLKLGWKTIKNIIGHRGVSSFSPIWYDFYTSYLHKANLDLSISKGDLIFLIADFSNTSDTLHQYKPKKMGLISPQFIDYLANVEDTKGLFSSHYRMMLDKSLANIQMPGRKGWEKNIEDIDGETWQAFIYEEAVPAVCDPQII